jgi:hypothetical protein
MKTLVLAALPLFSLSACGSEEVIDELAGETAEDAALDNDGKADAAVDGAYTFFELHGDMRKCSFPLCGGHFLDRVNRTTTKCHDGSSAEACYTPELDFSESGISQAGQDLIRSASFQGAIEGSAKPLVRGRFAKKNFNTPSPALGRFVVTEVWLPQGPFAADGVFVRIHDNGLRCIQAPCPSTGEKGLNTSRSASISDIDFSMSGVTEDAWGELVNELVAPHGLIIAGDRFNVSIEGRKGKGRTATNVYKRFVDEASACRSTGCSGQICADQDVITTCEFREEYACYQTATCERQADGACGWTATPELEACLGSFGEP